MNVLLFKYILSAILLINDIFIYAGGQSSAHELTTPIKCSQT